MADYIPAGPWDINPELWDRVSFDGREFLGLATVEVDRGNKWQTKAAKGSHGAERTFSGVELAKVRIEYRVWTSEQYAELVDEMLPLLEPEPTKGKRDAIAVAHAVATARKLNSITIDSIAGPRRAEPGIFALYIDATEQRPPETKNGTGTAGGKGGTQCQQLRAQYQAQRDKAAALRAEAEALLKVFNLNGWFAKKNEAEAMDAFALNTALQIQVLGCQEGPPTGFGDPYGQDGIYRTS